MRTPQLLTVCLAFIVMVGCGSEPEKESASVDRIQWQFNDMISSSVKTNSERIEKLEAATARTIPTSLPPQKTRKTSNVTNASYEPKKQELETVTDVETMPESAPEVLEPQSVVSTPMVEQAFSQPQTFSGPQLVNSQRTGQRTYSAPRYAGSKTVTKTRKVAKTVYEDVPYQVSVPVQMRDVFETVQETYEVPVSKTVMTTETRQRTRTVMVPKEVVENYSVQVPKTVASTETRTRSRKVKVGEEPVQVAPPRMEAAISYSAPRQPTPIQYSAPVQYSAPMQPVCEIPAPVQAFAASTPMPQVVETAYQVAAAPVQQMVCENCKPVQQSFSATPAYSTQVVSSPQRTFSTPFRSALQSRPTFSGVVKSQGTSPNRIFQRARRNGGTGVMVSQ